MTPVQRLKEIILYISKQSADDRMFGETKLNKLLFFSDFYYYKLHLKPITGVPYVRQPQGPVPDDMKLYLGQMHESGDIDFEFRDFYGRIQTRVIPKRQPDLAAFGGDQIAFVDQVLADYRQYTAKQISDASHEFLGWIITIDGETIPYETVLVGEAAEPDEKAIKIASELLAAC